MALSALGAVAALDVGSTTAEAAPSVSPFAGTYVGGDPRRVSDNWGITISDGGRIEGLLSGGGVSEGSITGQVSAGGGYSFTMSYRYIPRARRDGPYGTQVHKYTGKLALNGDGNIGGTAKQGVEFVWLRQ